MNEDLLRRAKEDPYFKQEIRKNRQLYEKCIKESSHNQLPSSLGDIMKKIKVKNKEIYMYFGYMQPSVKKQVISDIAIYMAKHFQPSTKNCYKFVFFNENTENNYTLWNFRKVFEYLDVKYIAALEEFIIVKPYFYHKAMDWMTFGVIQCFIKDRTKFVYSYTELCKKIDISFTDLANNVPPHLFKKELPDLTSSVDPGDYRLNIEGQEISEVEKKQALEFQNSIRGMIIKTGYEINNLRDYEVGEEGVPTMLKMLVLYFETHEDGLKAQGLFRKSVSIDEEEETISQILTKNYDYLLEVSNPHIIACLIKKFFSSLKVPAIPFAQFHQLMNDQSVSDKSAHLKSIFSTLPQLNKITLTFIFNFFKEKVIKHQPDNRMNANNIAICFAPCILRAEKPSFADIIFSSKSVGYCKIALNQMQAIFGSPKQQETMYRNSYLQSKKSFEETLGVQKEDNSQKQDNNKHEDNDNKQESLVGKEESKEETKSEKEERKPDKGDKKTDKENPINNEQNTNKNEESKGKTEEQPPDGALGNNKELQDIFLEYEFEQTDAANNAHPFNRCSIKIEDTYNTENQMEQYLFPEDFQNKN